MKQLAAMAIGLALVGGSGLAYAQNVTDAQIKQNLESQGYSNIKISRHEASHVDVTASKNGQVQKLAVNPQTGQIAPDTDNDHDED